MNFDETYALCQRWTLYESWVWIIIR